MLDLKDTVVVFDLDDTLYCENDYNISGVLAVCKELELLYGKNVCKQLLEARDQKQDIWLLACELLSLPDSVKQSMLWLYRLHRPDTIKLDKRVKQVLAKIHSRAKFVALLTDGRSISQRQKLQVLGLSEYPVYISEEYQSEKPDLARFQQLMVDLPASKYIYIGDNPKKDFIAPNSLGWTTYGVIGHCSHIHSQNIDNLPEEYLPKVWFKEISEFLTVLQ